MEMTILFARFGEIEGRPWANAQTATDFDADSESAGCQVGKIDVSTDNNCSVPRKLHRALVEAKGPVVIKADIGQKSKAGKVTSLIKDFTLVNSKS